MICICGMPSIIKLYWYVHSVAVNMRKLSEEWLVIRTQQTLTDYWLNLLHIQLIAHRVYKSLKK